MKGLFADRQRRVTEERGSALLVTLMLLLILTAIGIYAVSISTTEIDIALNTRVGTVTRNVAEAGAHFGIEQIPTTYSAGGGEVTQTLTVGPNMTSSYTVSSGLAGPLTIQPGYGVNYRFADFNVISSVSAPPTGFTAGARVGALVSYGPIPSGTGY